LPEKAIIILSIVTVGKTIGSDFKILQSEATHEYHPDCDLRPRLL
jgi:hypothetical protein